MSEEDQASYKAMEKADIERYELEKDLENAVCVNIECTFPPETDQFSPRNEIGMTKSRIPNKSTYYVERRSNDMKVHYLFKTMKRKKMKLRL